ncbi:MAG TPA: hypothetical protein VM165_06195, partial [Planctomycetaceae bacterium]|nr:hypothetical protein [Planctomycetaceae bacterium]
IKANLPALQEKPRADRKPERGAGRNICYNRVPDCTTVPRASFGGRDDALGCGCEGHRIDFGCDTSG